LTTYQLPRPTQVPIRRTGNVFDNLITLAVMAAVCALVAAGADYAVHLADDEAVYYTFILIAIPVYLKFGSYVILTALRFGGVRRLTQPSRTPPPIDVIGPAYNEATNIVRWVESVDRAAVAYGGPVRLILCDDGSTDETRWLAEQAMSRAMAVRGMVIAG